MGERPTAASEFVRQPRKDGGWYTGSLRGPKLMDIVDQLL